MTAPSHSYATDEDGYKQRLLDWREILSNGCWRFTGASANGYGRMKYKGRLWQVTRLSLFLFKPEEYKEELQVNHKCDYRRCFNPDHLYSGTQVQNMKDYHKRGKPEFEKLLVKVNKLYAKVTK